MYVFLLAIGAIAAIAGVFLIGFGFLMEFSFGNALLVAGTVALMGGLLLIGIAAALRQLQRIAEALAVRPAARGSRPLAHESAMREGAEPGPTRLPVPARIPFPQRPPEPARERPTEPRLASLPPDEHEAEEPDRARPNIVPIPRSADPPLSEPENLPMFPQIGGRAGSRGPAGEGRSEPKFDAPRRPNVVPGGRGEKASPRFGAAGERPSPEGPGRGSFFDAVWPAGSKNRKQAPEAGGRSRPEPAPSPGRGGANPPEDEPMPSIVRAPSAPAPESRPSPAAESRQASILKSGVIDGMAYTLYTDGSIEAQLPQGLMRFDSIEALRVHLEKSA